MSNTIILKYNQMPIQFHENGYLHATAIAKHFGKKVNNYLRMDSTNEYIKALEESETLNSVSEQNQAVIVNKGGNSQEQGTWLHPKLAIHYARWLSAKFAVWCDLQIEQLMSGHPAKALPQKKETVTLSKDEYIDMMQEHNALLKDKVSLLELQQTTQPRRRNLTDDECTEIDIRIARGESVADAAHAINRSPATISSYLRRVGVA